MKATCRWCHRVHDNTPQCIYKPKSNNKKETEANKFRRSTKWTKKAIKIKERDRYMCRLCESKGIFNTKNLEVHHIISLADDFYKKLDNNNLITLCRECHEKAEAKEVSAKALTDIISPPLVSQ